MQPGTNPDGSAQRRAHKALSLTFPSHYRSCCTARLRQLAPAWSSFTLASRVLSFISTWSSTFLFNLHGRVTLSCH
ncbi:hypothetical protein ASPBRDRAFT_640238 [Aspergillus brasiliensis CBS 101740]|uniref:Uncharacterized protein n=1 Tax=Aspergillus brasiliensis (strain CBS 101740 / IMI 381727 / IBT 21946) TaxID=767769 RepID=A0A1L9UDP4_ASPBC|nr:hypothetical protein ASPBRDRAFT_640238 [Aspergillus brasiliensis CBS 101740]